MPITTSKPSVSIPTIDISPYITSPTSLSALKVIDSVRTACTTTGFFQIVGHGVPRALQDEVFAASKEFFKLPLDEKEKLDRGNNGGPSNRGYEVMGTQALEKGQTKADMKEGFYISQSLPKDHPLVQRHPQFAGENVWPPESALAHEKFRDPMERYYSAVLSVTKTLFAILAAGLPYGPEIFDEFMSNNPLAVIRPLHYPPSPEGDIGAGAHTDFGALTLLLQDANPGLQVRDPATGAWIDVPPNADAYVVNIGDMLDKWTRGRYRSTLHRVINEGNSERYSVPFFFDGNLDCRLVPFDGEVEGETVITVAEHMRERFASTYVQKA